MTILSLSKSVFQTMNLGRDCFRNTSIGKDLRLFCECTLTAVVDFDTVCDIIMCMEARPCKGVC